MAVLSLFEIVLCDFVVVLHLFVTILFLSVVVLHSLLFLLVCFPLNTFSNLSMDMVADKGEQSHLELMFIECYHMLQSVAHRGR